MAVLGKKPLKDRMVTMTEQYQYFEIGDVFRYKSNTDDTEMILTVCQSPIVITDNFCERTCRLFKYCLKSENPFSPACTQIERQDRDGMDVYFKEI